MSSNSESPIASGPELDHEVRYATLARNLHWIMAAGFVLMWLTGVLVTNVEGVPFFTESDWQGAIRDFHKSIGLTLLALLIVRAALRFIYPAPPLPSVIPDAEQKRAHMGHVMIYAVIIAACITGFAIADLHEYGNSYFGIALPQLFPTTDRVFGWSSTPWAYVLHAIVAYGLLALIVGHVVFVRVHKTKHGVSLLPRMLDRPWATSATALNRVLLGVLSGAAIILSLAIFASVTLGPEEVARDYWQTTPFAR